MRKKSVSTAISLLSVLTLIVVTCGWIPFTAPYTLHTDPEGATVYKEGATTPLGVTPFNSQIFHRDQKYEIRMPGFFDESFVVDYNASKDLYLDLKPLPILLETTPSASVYAEGSDTPMGSTPLEMAIYRQDRSYILKAKDYYDKQITIGLNTETPLNMDLVRRPIVTLTTSPAGVKIYENNALLATSTLTEEILTPRTFELRKEGYYKKTIQLTSVSSSRISESLTPLPVINIKTDPAAATVYLIGKNKPLGNSPIRLTIEQPTGFEVRADRYYSKTITLQPKSQTATVELDAMPYVTITSEPAGAEVYQNGKRIGLTPIEQLIEKKTTYEIRREGFVAQTLTLNGKNAQPKIKLDRIPPPVVVEEVVVTNTEPAVVVAAEPVEQASEKSGMNLPLIGGIIIAIIAALLVIVMKKKKA